MKLEQIQPNDDVAPVATCIFTNEKVDQIRDEFERHFIPCDFESNLGLLSVLVRSVDLPKASELLQVSPLVQLFGLTIIFPRNTPPRRNNRGS